LLIEVAMHVFTFRSRTFPGVTAFTTWRTGSNLPEELRPWALVGQSAMHFGDPVTGVYRGADTVLEEIDRNGFYVARVDAQARSMS
jgi:hypothetical protein